MKKLDAEAIGKLCMTEAGDGYLPIQLSDALHGAQIFPDDWAGELARICGELYEELESARNEPDQISRWIESHVEGVRSSSPGLPVTVALLRLLADFKKRFPAVVAEDPDGFRMSDTDMGGVAP